MPKPNSKTIAFLTQDETAGLVRELGDHKRNEALFLLVDRHGLRASEVGLLQRSNLDFKKLRIIKTASTTDAQSFQLIIVHAMPNYLTHFTAHAFGAGRKWRPNPLTHIVLTREVSAHLSLLPRPKFLTINRNIPGCAHTDGHNLTLDPQHDDLDVPAYHQLLVLFSREDEHIGVLDPSRPNWSSNTDLPPRCAAARGRKR